MESLLFEALQRVREGKPQNQALAELARRRKLRVSVSSVAQEAGVSRTLIGYEGCRYPAVRTAILGVKPPTKNKRDLRTANANLRVNNQILEERLNLALAEQAAMLNRMRQMEAEYEDKISEFRRVYARKGRDENHIVNSNVVPIKKKD